MVVAMSIMRMMKAAIHEITGVAPVWHGFMPTPGSVYMPCFVMKLAGVDRVAAIWIGRRHFDYVLVHVVFMGMVQMAIMKVVDMVPMPDGCVATARAVNMGVVCMLRV